MTKVENLVNENEELKDTVFNLRLFLTDLMDTVVSPDDWAAFEKKHSGLPGFVEVRKDE